MTIVWVYILPISTTVMLDCGIQIGEAKMRDAILMEKNRIICLSIRITIYIIQEKNVADSSMNGTIILAPRHYPYYHMEPFILIGLIIVISLAEMMTKCQPTC